MLCTGRMLKRATFSPAQPRQLLHPPALRLPRQPPRPRTRHSAGKAAASEEPEAYPLGRTVRRIRSTTSVRAAELVRRPGPRLGFERSENDVWEKWRVSARPGSGGCEERLFQHPARGGLGGWPHALETRPVPHRRHSDARRPSQRGMRSCPREWQAVRITGPRDFPHPPRNLGTASALETPGRSGRYAGDSGPQRG